MRNALLRLTAATVLAITAAAPTGVGAQDVGDTAPVYIEDSPAAQELIAEAQALREQGRLAEASAVIQRAIEQYADKLMPLAADRFTSTRRWAEQRLTDDPAWLAAYRQSFEAAAQRRLAEAGEPGRSEAAALWTVLERYPLTDAALTAALRLAGRMLERADPTGAAGALDRVSGHPSLPDRAAAYHRLRGAAAVFLGDDATLQTHRLVLRGRGDAEALGWLDALANRLSPPADLAPDEPGPDPGVLTQPDPVLWHIEFDETPSPARRVMLSRLRRTAGGEDTFLPVLPVIDAQRLLINRGDGLLALDRASGRELWRYRRQLEPSPDAQAARWPARSMSSVTDRRGVAVRGQTVFAVVGEPLAWTAARQRGIDPTSLAAIDAATGRDLWRIEPDDLDPALDDALFRGTPIADGDRVYALVQRGQVTGFKTVFVVAVDARSGEPLWRRHLSSIVTNNRYPTSPMAQMVHHGARLYVTDQLATVACLSARSGDVVWLRRLAQGKAAVDSVMARIQERGAKALGPPVLSPAGLIVGLSDGPERSAVLDPDTGRTLRRLTGPGWDDGPQLLPLGGDVLRVGHTAARLDGESLEPRWETPLSGDADEGWPWGSAATGARHLWVVAGEALWAIELDSGRLAAQAEVGDAANVALGPDQVVLSTADRVEAIMAWDDAYAGLTARARAEPLSAGPGLGLAHVAMTLGRSGVVLEAVDQVLGVADRQASAGRSDAAERTRQALYAQLRAMIEPDDGLEPPLRGALLDRLAMAASSPAEQMGFHLLRGGFEQQAGDPAAAAEHYQAVAGDAAMSAALFGTGGHDRRAGGVAASRLMALLGAHGRALYAPHEARAQQRLEALRRQGGGPEELAALADRFPVSAAAAAARLDAADRYAQRGEQEAAARQLVGVLRLAPAGPRLGEAVDRLMAMAEGGQAPGAALWLRRAARQRPDAALGDGPDALPLATRLAAWSLPTAVPSPTPEPAPTIPPDFERVVARPGRLLQPLVEPPAEQPPALVTLGRSRLRLYERGGSAPAWEVQAPAQGLTLLAVTHRLVVVREVEAGTVHLLDRATGAAAFEPLSAEAMFEGIRFDAPLSPQQRVLRELVQGPGAVQVRGNVVVRINGRPAAEPDHTLAAVSDGVLVLGYAPGPVVAVSLEDGRVLWRATLPIERIERVTAHGPLVAVSGVGSAGGDTAVGMVTVLGVRSGEPWITPIEDRDTPQWMGWGPGGALALAVGESVAVYDPVTGGLRWRAEELGTPGATVAGRFGRRGLTLVRSTGQAVLLDPEAGSVLGRAEVPGSAGGGGAGQAVVDAHGMVVRSLSAVGGAGAEGGSGWRDAIGGPGSTLAAMAVGPAHVAVLRVPEPQPDGPEDAAGRPVPTLFLLDRATGRVVSAYSLPGLENAADASLHPLGAALALGLGDRTLVLEPGP